MHVNGASERARSVVSEINSSELETLNRKIRKECTKNHKDSNEWNKNVHVITDYVCV